MVTSSLAENDCKPLKVVGSKIFYKSLKSLLNKDTDWNILFKYSERVRMTNLSHIAMSYGLHLKEVKSQWRKFTKFTKNITRHNAPSITMKPDELQTHNPTIATSDCKFFFQIILIINITIIKLFWFF